MGRGAYPRGQGRRTDGGGARERSRPDTEGRDGGASGAQYSVVGLVAYSGQGRPAFLEYCNQIPLAHVPWAALALTTFADPSATSSSAAQNGGASKSADGPIVPVHVSGATILRDDAENDAMHAQGEDCAAGCIEAFEDADARVIYLFLRFPEAELSVVNCKEASYFSLEQQMLYWECHLLLLFLSSHTVMMLISGARFPPSLLQTLRALQSAKVALFDANVLSSHGSSRPGAGARRKGNVRGGAGQPGKDVSSDASDSPPDPQHASRGPGEDEHTLAMCGAQVLDWVPALGFVMEPPGILAGVDQQARFEKALDAQIRQILDSESPLCFVRLAEVARRATSAPPRTSGPVVQ